MTGQAPRPASASERVSPFQLTLTLFPFCVFSVLKSALSLATYSPGSPALLALGPGHSLEGGGLSWAL